MSTSMASGSTRRYCRAASANRAAWSRISVALRHPSLPGGRVPRRHSASRAWSGCMPSSMSRSMRSPTVHSSRALMSTGMAVLDPVDLPRQRVVERAEEPLDRIPEECREVGERHVFGRGSGQRAGDERRSLGAVAFARAGRSQHRGVEREGLVGYQLPGDDVASIEGLQRMPDDDGVADLVRRRHVEGVEQFGQRHRGRSLLAGVFVGAGVGDHELLAGCADGVEQQLPVLGTNVALAGHRVAGEHVVAVDNAEPREHAVVEPDQADHPMRHRAHRHHRADRQRSGAEVGAGRASGQVAFQQCADVGQPHRRVRPWACAFQDVGEFALQLAGLPRVVIVDLGQQLDAVLERVEPVAQWSCAGE